jgi:hypothetical protein
MRTNRMLLVGAAALVVAAVVALSQDKTPPRARPKPASPPGAQAAAPATNVKAADDFPVIGYLEKRDRTITIKAGPKGPLYSVKTADGKVLCENISADQLRAQAPEIADFLKTAVAGTGSTNKADARVRPIVDASILDSRR